MIINLSWTVKSYVDCCYYNAWKLHPWPLDQQECSTISKETLDKPLRVHGSSWMPKIFICQLLNIFNHDIPNQSSQSSCWKLLNLFSHHNFITAWKFLFILRGLKINFPIMYIMFTSNTFPHISYHGTYRL